MDFEDTAEEARYRSEVRAYLESHRDELFVVDSHSRTRPTPETVPVYRQTQRVLADGGYVAVTWPREYGGAGGTPMQQAIVAQELTRFRIPPLIGYLGLGMCGPTILAHGSEQMRRRHLPPIVRAEQVWCQLFSEPGAGSDLAALATRAERTEDGGWSVTGQKVWTTGAHYSDFGLLLARTDPDRALHRGLTMFGVDMRAPGVTVRPLRQMSGGTDFNEVFFDATPILDELRIGEVGDGWRVAITTLMAERLTIGGGGTDLGIGVEPLTRHAALRLPGLPADRQLLARQTLADLWIEALACRFTGYRRLTAVAKGGFPGPEAAAGKLAGTAVAVGVADLGVQLLGDDAMFAETPRSGGLWQSVMLALPGLAIAGGTNEILKNILGERVLGLPGDGRAERRARDTGDTGGTGDRGRTGERAKVSPGAGTRRGTGPR